MAVINNAAPAPATTDSGSGMGFLLGVILLIVFAFIVLFYGLPMLRQSMSGPQINIPSVPNKFDVNVHTNK